MRNLILFFILSLLSSSILAGTRYEKDKLVISNNLVVVSNVNAGGIYVTNTPVITSADLWNTQLPNSGYYNLSFLQAFETWTFATNWNNPTNFSTNGWVVNDGVLGTQGRLTSPAITNAGLVMRFRMDNSWVDDVSGLAATSTSANAAWFTNVCKVGVAGGGFRGSSTTQDCVVALTTNTLNGATGFTVSCWANVKIWNANGWCGFFTAADDSDIVREVGIRQGPLAGSIQLIVMPNGSTFCTATNNMGTGSIILTNTWYHFVGTWRKDTGYCALYTNGVLAGTNTPGALNTTTMAQFEPFCIGALNYNGGLKRAINGLIDECTVFNRAMTSNEVSTFYSMYVGGASAGNVIKLSQYGTGGANGSINSYIEAPLYTNGVQMVSWYQISETTNVDATPETNSYSLLCSLDNKNSWQVLTNITQSGSMWQQLSFNVQSYTPTYLRWLKTGNNLATPSYLLLNDIYASYNWRSSIPAFISSEPTATNYPGSMGQMYYSSNYLYICVSSNIWRRTTLGGW